MTFKTAWLAPLMLSLAVTGCDSGSVGEFESEGGTDSSSGSSASGAGTSSGSASAGTGSSDSATSTSGASSSSGGTGSETGVAETGVAETGVAETGSSSGGPINACEGLENHTCSMPVDCGESCGELDSMFDVNGCARQPCSLHADCGASQFCYRPLDYGGCQSSHVGCDDDGSGMCMCASLPDCGGAYCVDEDIVFGGAVQGPGDGLASDVCGPDDGPAFFIRTGTYLADACGGSFAEEPVVEITVGEPLGTMGSFVTDETAYIWARYAADGVNFETAPYAVLYVTQADATLSGEYEITLEDDTVIYGAYTVVSCPEPNPLPCG